MQRLEIKTNDIEIKRITDEMKEYKKKKFKEVGEIEQVNEKEDWNWN